MNRIKTSEANKTVVTSLTSKRFKFKDDRTIAQIAIAYSLQLNQTFDIEKDYLNVDNRGKDYPESILGAINTQTNDGVYRAILNQHYGKRLTDDEFTKYIKLHLDHGLQILNRDLLQSSKGKNAHIDYLLGVINGGLSLIDSAPTIRSSSEIRNISAYTGVLEVELGRDSDTKEPLIIRINDENYFDSQHFAVAGMNGSGKTQLIQDVLYQISEQSNDELKFIFFDYKGEGKSEKLKSFLAATNCKFIDVQKEPFEFNPLTYINLTNERTQTYNIKSFRDTIASIDRRIGVKQKSSLEIALKKCFEVSKKNGKHPSITELNKVLLEYYEDNRTKPDTLTGILGELADGVFADDYDPTFKLYDKSMYINLPPTLPDTARQASVFLTLNYLLSEFINCNDVKTSPERIKPIRYIIVIDEAHAYLKNKSMAKVLEDLLRMIRSKGVIIMMLSQGIEEYKQKDFDFASQIKIPILLNIQNKDMKLAKSFLGTPKSEVPLRKALNDLDSGKGVINFGEPKLLDVNMFWRRGL